MIFMYFKLPRDEDGNTVGWNTISISLDHIVTIQECDTNWKHSYIELDSGKVYEVEGCWGDILDEIAEAFEENKNN